MPNGVDDDDDDEGAEDEDPLFGGETEMDRVEFRFARKPGMHPCSPSKDAEMIPKCESLMSVFTPFHRT